MQRDVWRSMCPIVCIERLVRQTLDLMQSLRRDLDSITGRAPTIVAPCVRQAVRFMDETGEQDRRTPNSTRPPGASPHPRPSPFAKAAPRLGVTHRRWSVQQVRAELVTACCARQQPFIPPVVQQLG